MERDMGALGGFLPLSSSPSRLRWPIAHSFMTALAEAAKQWKIQSTMFPHQRCFLFDLHLSFTDSHEYGRWIWANFEVPPSSTRDRLVNHEMAFTEGVWTHLDWLKALSSLGNFLTFILCLGHKDQVKCYHNNRVKGNWWSIILHNSSLDIYHHLPSIGAT